SDNIAAGESDCTQGNDPTSTANIPPNCVDGSFSDLASGNISYTSGPLYATAAFEWHHAVNRQTDIASIYGFTNNFTNNQQTGGGLPAPDIGGGPREG